MTARGWKSDDLPVVGDDGRLWTAADAARLLGPPELSAAQVRHLVRLFNLTPVGKRRTSPHGVSGRYARVYRSTDLLRAFDAVYRAMETTAPGQ